MRYLGALSERARGDIVLLGAPFDGTESFRAGARFGPNAIREASTSLETYSPFLDVSLDDLDYIDCGDLELPPGSAVKTLEIVTAKVRDIYQRAMKSLLIGGEHTVSLGAVQAAFEKYPDLKVLQLDAHLDLRDEYLGDRLSHATVMRRISEIVGVEGIIRFGVRAGTREEMEGSGLELPLGLEGGQRDIERIMRQLPDDRPLYVTVDLDVFDPSFLPGVGNPEPLGITYREFIQIVRILSRLNVIGADVVELAPQYDQTGVSSVVAASVVRELLLTMAPREKE
ncbi:MAG: agmatinase [Calditrichaeota bacterium]|nr:agmatinase [Calditrichota bacterium]